MCEKAVEDVPDHLKTEEIFKEAVHRAPYTLKSVPDQCRTRDEECPWWLKKVPDRFKTKRMCKKAVEDKPENL